MTLAYDKNVSFDFFLTIWNSFSISFTHHTIDLSHIQNCDLQVRRKYTTTNPNSTLIFENEMIERSSKWASQNTWNLGGEMIDYYYDKTLIASLDFPFRFRQAFTIVIAENLPDARTILFKENGLFSNHHCKNNQVVYIFFVPVNQPIFLNLNEFINVLKLCNMLSLLMFKEHTKVATILGHSYVTSNFHLYFVCQFCSNNYSFYGKLLNVASFFNGILEPIAVKLTKEAMLDLRKMHFSNLHGSSVVANRFENCQQYEENNIENTLEKTVKIGLKKLIICEPLNMFSSLASKKLNFTVRYLDSSGLAFYQETYLGKRMDLLYGDIGKDLFYTLSVFIRKSKEYYVIYCETKQRTQFSSLLYWITIFHFKVWILILSSFVLTCFISCNGNTRDFKNIWFQMVRYSFRQNVRWSNKFHIYISIGCIVISIAYEAVITSQVIKPLPVVVYGTVNEMLAGGFKFLLKNVELIIGLGGMHVLEIKGNHLQDNGAMHRVYYEVLLGLLQRNFLSEARGKFVEIFQTRANAGCGITTTSCMNNENFDLAIVFESRYIWSSLLELNYDLSQSKHCHYSRSTF